jgi:hypothetical protein
MGGHSALARARDAAGDGVSIAGGAHTVNHYLDGRLSECALR